MEEVSFQGRAEGWFTGRDRSTPRPPVGDAGNLSHQRPHRPGDLARDRSRVGRATRTDPTAWHVMRQVHGARVGVISAALPPGTELRGVDALVTREPDRSLVVQVADCVPVLVASDHVVGAIHAGRRGVVSGIVAATLDALEQLDVDVAALQAAVGPAIGGCCYEVDDDVRDAVLAAAPDAATTTTWGTPSLDLPKAVAMQLAGAGVTDVRHVGGCTRCDAHGRWFSHRADPTTGRQVGLVVRRGEDAP